MFCVTIKWVSVYFWRFPFLSYFLVFLCTISSVCRLKYPYSCFSSHFCFLSCFCCSLSVYILPLMLMAALIGISLFWTVLSTQSSILVSPLPPYFLDTYSLSVSPLGCKTIYIVVSVLVLRSICWSSSFVHFKNVSEYPKRKTVQVFIPLMIFLQYCLVLSSFLVLLQYSFFNFFFHVYIFYGVC